MPMNKKSCLKCGYGALNRPLTHNLYVKVQFIDYQVTKYGFLNDLSERFADALGGDFRNAVFDQVCAETKCL